MYVIVVYDAKSPKRGTKLLKFLRQNLIWVQNSVFEGEVTKAGLNSIITGMKSLIEDEYDSIIYYTFDSQSYLQRAVIGLEKNTTDNFV